MQAKELLFKILYLFLHNLLTVFEVVFNVLMYIKNKCINYCDLWLIRNEQEYILKSTRNVSKLPTHLTILLGEESPSYKDLAKLTHWSMALGIGYISFYDYKGNIKESQDKLKRIIEDTRNPGDDVIWNDEHSSYTNGIKGRKICVKTLSSSDGRPAIVDVTKELAITKDNKICAEVVDSCFKKKYNFPDPELGLYCGRNFKLFSYPPWQIRTTEFLSLHSHHDLSPRTFIKLLFQYSKIEQRHGK